MPITQFHCLDLLDRKRFYNNSNILYDLFQGKIEVDNNLFNETLKLWIIDTDFNKPGFKLSPDFLRYVTIVLNLKLVCNINKKSKYTNCYININGLQKKIRKQDWFTYTFVYFIKNSLKKNRKKSSIHNEIFKQLFTYDKLLGITKFNGVIENNRRIHSSPYPKRTDLEFRLFDGKISFIVEFLEKRSHNNYNQFEIDSFRIYQITKNHHDIKASWLILEETLINDGIDKFFKKLTNKAISLITDLYLLNDERTFIVGKLEIITGNRTFSEMLYDSNHNQDDFCINIEAVNNFIMCWKNKKCKKEYGTYFKNISSQLINKSSNDDVNILSQLEILDLSDCDDSETECDTPCEKFNFICDKKGDIEYFNFVGFQQYIYMIDIKYLINPKAKMNLGNLYINLSRGLIDTFKERFQQLKNSNDNSFMIF